MNKPSHVIVYMAITQTLTTLLQNKGGRAGGRERWLG